MTQQKAFAVLACLAFLTVGLWFGVNAPTLAMSFALCSVISTVGVTALYFANQAKRTAGIALAGHVVGIMQVLPVVMLTVPNVTAAAELGAVVHFVHSIPMFMSGAVCLVSLSLAFALLNAMRQQHQLRTGKLVTFRSS